MKLKVNRFYKFGFWFLVSIVLILFNIFRITKIGYKKNFDLYKSNATKRLLSLYTSNTILNRKVDSINGNEIITGKKKENLFKGKVLAILLSDFKCDRCQLNELKRLLRIEKELKTKGIKIIGITTKNKIDLLIPQRKIIHIDFPLYYVSDEKFYNELSFSKDFPQIIFVANNIILSALKPIVKDDEFSEKYYSHLISMLATN